jgi:hypothetical protein
LWERAGILVWLVQWLILVGLKLLVKIGNDFQLTPVLPPNITRERPLLIVGLSNSLAQDLGLEVILSSIKDVPRV